MFRQIFYALLIALFAAGSFGGLTTYIAGGMLLVLLTSAAVFLFLAGLVAFAVKRQPSLIYLSLALLLTIGLSAGLGVVYAEHRTARMKENAMKLAAVLGRFKTAHGRYPVTLQEVNGETSGIPLDDFEYEPAGRDDFLLKGTIYCRETYQKSLGDWHPAACR